jgi:DNA-binding NtrC family response regulator
MTRKIRDREPGAGPKGPLAASGRLPEGDTAHGQPTERLEAEPARIRVTRGVLVVQDGPDAGRTVALETGSLTIGSSRACDLVIREATVSKKHAELIVTGGRFMVRDLGSTNGTRLNGTDVREAFLKPGDVVELGRSRVRFTPRQEEVRVLPSARDQFGPVHGASLAMRQLFGILERVAPTDATLLIQGETGTGKDLVARAIHDASPRAARPLVVLDCSAISPDLVASELFGHTEGAFTGASRRREGAFEEASGGTIFLDEIGELPLDVQPKLLRVLENREVRPLGSNRTVAVDVRIVAATHRDLARMVDAGRFREDLYFRLAVVRVDLPPLRQRTEDLPGLTAALLAGMKSRFGPPEIGPEALSILASQSWPGNVRELRNVLERTIALASGPRIEAADLMLTSGAGRAATGPAFDVEGRTLEEIEKEVIRRTMARAHGSQKEMARLLGIHPNTLREKLRRYGLKE